MRTTRIAHVTVLATVAMAVVGAPGPGAWGHPGQSHGRPPEPSAVEASFGRRVEFDAPAPGSYRLPVIKPAPDGAVLDAGGVERRLHQLMAGKVVVLSFVYTQCSDARGCPLATAVLSQIHQASASDPALAEHLKLITLSFDPAHDTPAVMARYARPRDPAARASEWQRLTTASERALAPILAGYGQLVSRPTGGRAAGLTHRLRVYLIDPQRRIRNIYGLDFLDPGLLLADVRTLLLEEQRGRR
jgi:cytochrome oxidase Cu insertion factor (SCO1/SenC/PrrC family)